MAGEQEIVLDGDDDAFDAGFGTSPDETFEETTITPEPEEVEVEKVVEPEVPKIKYAKVTEEQLQNLLTKAAEVDVVKAEAKRQFDSAFGTIGNLKQIINQIQAGTQQGKTVELTAEDVAEISDMYPDLGAAQLKVLQKVANKLKGTGQVVPFDESKIDQRVLHNLKPTLETFKDNLRNELAAEDLSDEYPKWREIVGPADSKTAFRVWLNKQADGYEAKILNSNNGRVIAGALKRFDESTKKPVVTTKPDKRKERFAEAVTPRGAGGHASVSKEEDPFDVGFKRFK